MQLHNEGISVHFFPSKSWNLELETTDKQLFYVLTSYRKLCPQRMSTDLLNLGEISLDYTLAYLIL